MHTDPVRIAVHRLGLGARPGERERVARDPRGWVRQQIDRGIDRGGQLADLPTGAEIGAELAGLRRERGQEAMRKRAWEHYEQEARARITRFVRSEQPLRDRMVALFANHFTVSARAGGGVNGLVGAHEREAIRPHVFGRFRKLLGAAVLHPAMLVYLDNYRSVGPASVLGRRRSRGLNENLAREVLELHTLGVDGGYAQSDVRAFAEVLTGWGVDPERGIAAFREGAHEPGAKRLLGREVSGPGREEAQLVLDLLAGHPSTAARVCTRIARHFLADDPPDEAVDALVATWTRTEGDLGAVMIRLTEGPWLWEGPADKLKSPWELVISMGRAVGAQAEHAEAILRSLRFLGQAPWMAPSPAGWPEVAAEWLGPEALARRLALASELGRGLAERTSPLRLARSALGEALSPATRDAIQAAASPALGLAILLASPELQWR